MLNRDSNSYTYIFAAIMVFVVAASLAFTATSLKERQDENIKKEKMQNILTTIGIDVDREQAALLYSKYIVEELALNSDGTIDSNVNAFEIKLSREVKKPVDTQKFPLYIAKVDNQTFYIIPLHGAGLWNAIWGYISLYENKNDIKGVMFDHTGETAGLGAEITTDWFQKSFENEKIFNTDNKLVGINVSKTNNDPNGDNKNDNKVDAIAGATITGDGVTDMIKERLSHYLPYFNKINL